MLTTNKRKTGQPWMLAVGLRKPHLPYRFPKPYLDMLPPLSETDVAQHWRLDASVPAIAHASGWLALALTRTLTPTLTPTLTLTLPPTPTLTPTPSLTPSLALALTSLLRLVASSAVGSGLLCE